MTAPIASGWSESPGGPCTHWKAPPFHGARRKRSSAGADHTLLRGSPAGLLPVIPAPTLVRPAHCPPRLSGAELPVALFNAASALVPGNGGADVVWASPLARCGDLLLRLARCQRKDPIIESRRRALAASGFCGRGAPAPAGSCWSSRPSRRGRHFC